MEKPDPLEQTQENLHPIIVAHRARDAQPVRQRFDTSVVLLSAVIMSGIVLAWLLLVPRA